MQLEHHIKPVLRKYELGSECTEALDHACALGKTTKVLLE
jgi:hypothetical protein